MPETVDISDAKARLQELVQRAARGEEIHRAQRRAAGAARTGVGGPPRTPGRDTGAWQVAQDFNDPLPPELLATFDGAGE